MVCTWIGLNDRNVKGTYEWTSSEVVDFTNWGVGEPNSLTGYQSIGANCVEMIPETKHKLDYNGTWNDENCDSTIPYICAIPNGGCKSVIFHSLACPLV